MSEITITADHIRELAEARYSDLAVLSLGRAGDVRVEPQSTAVSCGRTIIRDASSVLDWSGGAPMTDEDYAQFASELNTEIAERGN